MAFVNRTGMVRTENFIYYPDTGSIEFVGNCTIPSPEWDEFKQKMDEYHKKSDKEKESNNYD